VRSHNVPCSARASISAWKDGNKTFTINHLSHKRIEKMVLGTTYDPDINKENNVWEAK